MKQSSPPKRSGSPRGMYSGNVSSFALGLCLVGALLEPPVSRAAGEQASDAGLFDSFGVSAGQSGSIGLIGADGAKVGSNTSQGAAYVFRKVDTANGTITQDVKLVAGDGASNDFFGVAVSVSGTAVLAGASGARIGSHVQEGAGYLFRNLDTASGTVAQSVKLTASDGADYDHFGKAVSLSANIGVIGAYQAEVGSHLQQGAAYAFRNLDTATGALTQSVKLTASDGAASDGFGFSVSASGSMALIGAFRFSGANTSPGAAYVFKNLDTASGTITQSVKLVANDGASGDNYGYAVSESGSMGLVGALQAAGQSAAAGAAYLYRNLDTASGTVTQSAKLTASDGEAGDFFGYAVSESGSTALVSADDAAVASNSGQGAVYLFRNLDKAAGLVTQNVKLTASDGMGSDTFGSAVSLDGDRFIIGADGANNSTGKAYSGTVSSVTTLDTGNTTGVTSGLSFVSQDDWILGATTNGNQVTLSKGDTANVTATGKGVFIGKGSGSNSNTLLVQGTMLANAVTVGATGTTGNKLEIANNGSATGGNVTAAGGISVSSGGTLLLSGSSSVIDRLGNTTPVTLASGSRFATSGLSEGSSATGSTAGFGILSLNSGSTIDFASGANGSTLLAAARAGMIASSTVNILNWSGSMGSDSGAAGNDRLLFAVDPKLTLPELALFRFSDDNGQALGSGAREIAYNGFFEVVPIPEPSRMALLVVGLASLTRRHRTRYGRD